MKITVITVCLNSANTLEKTIQSVINQNYSDKEYIIVDGGSTDGTLNIIKKYERYITKWISEPDKGIFDAMNKGISMATGDVIAFLNSDDWYADSILLEIGKAFEENDCDCVCCDNYVVTKEGITRYYDVSNSSEEDIYKWMTYYHSAIFARKEMFCKQNNFDLKYKIAADYDWMLRNVYNGIKIFYLHKPAFTFCYGGISSVNEIECAREAREIAIHYLSANRQQYLKDINNRYYEIAVNAADADWIKNRIESVFDLKLPFVLWGAGYRGQQCLKWLQKADIQVAYIVDSDKNKWNSNFEGVEIKSPDILVGKVCNLIITPDGYSEEIKEKINGYTGAFIVYELKELWKNSWLGRE